MDPERLERIWPVAIDFVSQDDCQLRELKRCTKRTESFDMSTPQTTDGRTAFGKVLVVVLATKNEEANIGAVLSEIREAAGVLRPLLRTAVVMVDDNSTDATREVAATWAETLDLDFRIIDGPSTGLGAAVVAGMKASLELFGDRVGMIANLDADGQHDARELPTLVRSFLGRGLDLVVGSRWVRGGRSYGTSTFRTVGSNVGNAAFRMVTGVRDIKDATSAFRVYSPAASKHIVKNAGNYPTGYAFFSCIVADIDSAGLKLGEVPITFRPRYSGQSKLTRSEVSAFFSSLPKQRAIRRRPFESDPHVEYGAHDVLDSLSMSRRWNDWILDELSDDDPGPGSDVDILEVGAGNGAFGALLRSRWPNARIVSIEPDSQNYESLCASSADDPRWEAFHGTLPAWIHANGPDRCFSRAYYVSVLEHVQDPSTELTLVRGQMRAGGRVCVFVPGCTALYGPIDRRSGHYRRFTDHSLRELVESTGLRVDNVHYLDRLGVVPYWMLYRLLLRSSISPASTKLFDRVYVPATRRIDGLIPGAVPGKNVVLHASC